MNDTLVEILLVEDSQDDVDLTLHALRRERLAKAKAQLDRSGLGALLCFDTNNVRYITSTYIGEWSRDKMERYCVLPRGGEPILFETAGSDLECAKIDAPWLNGNIRPAITWKWAETAEQMMSDRMVQSIVDEAKIIPADSGTTVRLAVALKQPVSS